MISNRLFQALSKSVPPEKSEVTLRAFKQDPLIWKEFSSPENLERVTQEWPANETELTPANLALFKLDPALLQTGAGEIQPSVAVLEPAILAYEEYLQNKAPVDDFQLAANLALALYKKSQQNSDWVRLLRETATRQNLESQQAWMNYWGTSLVILNGWLEDRLPFLQALLQVKQPEFGLEMLRHLILSLPCDQKEKAGLYANALTFIPLSSQVIALQQLRLAGDDQLAKQVAGGLFERHLVKDVEPKSIDEIWQTSEKSLTAANIQRQLAAMAQISGDYESAENLLKNAIQNYSAELAGTLIQSSALNVERGTSPQQEIDQIPLSVRKNEIVQNEIAMILDSAAEPNEEPFSPLAVLLGSEAIYKAGNESLAKQIATETAQTLWTDQTFAPISIESRRALNWNPRLLLDQLIEFGLWQEARRLLDDLLKKSPTDVDLLHRSIQIARAMSDRDSLISGLETLTLLERDNSDQVRQLANEYVSAEDWADAYEGYENLIQNFGTTDTNDWLGYAEAALKVNKVPVAIEYAQKVLDSQPENGQALAILGYGHHKQGETEKALDFLNRSVLLSPDSIEPWLLMAELHKEKGETGKSIEVLQTARNTFPGARKIRLQLAKELLEQGQAADALATLNELAEENGADLDAALLKIRAQKVLNYSDCAELIEKTYRKFPTSPEIIYEYADSRLTAGDRDEAKKLLKPILTGVSIPSEWKLAYVDAVLGENYRNIHQNELPADADVQNARSILTQVLLSEPENIYAKMLTAEMVIKQGETAKAFEFLTNLLKESSTENSNWFDRIKAGFAWTAAFLKKFDLALSTIQNIVDAHPEWTAARQTLAEVDAATGEISTAVDQANQVLTIAPDVVQSAEWFANFMSNLGKKDEAEKAIQELCKTHADKFPLLVKLAEMKLESNDLDAAKNIAENFKHLLPKAKENDQIVRAAKVFDKLGDTQAVLDVLKLRAKNQTAAPEVALTDLAAYLRSKERFAETLKQIAEIEQKFGAQRWLELIKAETMHANGNSSEAYALLGALAESNDHRPDQKDLAFSANDWQGMLDENASVDTLEQVLAFESGNYEQVLTDFNNLAADPTSQVVRIEADLATGKGSETLPWLESTSADEETYADQTLAAQVSEILMDAAQTQTAGEILMSALERFPYDKVLKICASRQAGLSGDWITAEALFEQEINGFAKESKIVTAKSVCGIRNLVKTAAVLNRWPEAEAWSKRLFEGQPKNQSAQLTRLQVLVRALEFALQNQDLSIRQHILSSEKVEITRSELVSLIANYESNSNPEFEHWCARGKAVLEPTQANIRRLAMITPEASDIAAMMMALDRSGQNQTAVQLGKKHENDAAVLLATANCLKADRAQNALEALEKAKKMKMAFPPIYALGAQLSQKQGEYYSAINQIEEALEYWPGEAGWQEAAAENWKSVGDLQNSTAHLEKALQLEPENTTVQLKLGKLYLQGKEIQKAIECLQAVCKKEVNQFEGWEALAESYYQTGQIEQSLEAAKRATSINAFSVKPYLLGAQINLDQGKKAEALEQVQKAIQQDGNNAESLVILAKAWLANGNKLQALHALEKVPQGKGSNIALLIEHARMITEINGPANAKGMLESLAERYPDNLDVVNMLAEAQLAHGDKTGAEKTAQQSLKLHEVQPQMQRFLGKLEFEGGHLDQAIYHYSQAIAQAPQGVDSYLELSQVYEKQRDFASALNTLNMAIELDPKNLQAVMAAANMMRSAKDYSKAESLLRRAAEIAPNDLNVRRQLGAVIALNLVESSQEASSHI